MAQKVTSPPAPFPVQAGTSVIQLNQPSSSGTIGLPLSAVFERLRQLKAWQQQQQETLLRQQQEQLLKLRTEQTYQRAQVTMETAPNVDTQVTGTPKVRGQMA